jgi:predicted dehydrogenase
VGQTLRPKNVGLDAVVVAAPVKQHYSLAKASLLAGKHTLIEKPMASSSAECEELIEIAKRHGLVLMVGRTFLYSAPVRKIVEIVQAGDIGEIRYINSRRLNLACFRKTLMSPGIWRRTTSRSSCTSWKNFQ